MNDDVEKHNVFDDPEQKIVSPDEVREESDLEAAAKILEAAGLPQRPEETHSVTHEHIAAANHSDDPAVEIKASVLPLDVRELLGLEDKPDDYVLTKQDLFTAAEKMKDLSKNMLKAFFFLEEIMQDGAKIFHAIGNAIENNLNDTDQKDNND